MALLATMIMAPIAAMLIQAEISRSREFLSDAGAARIVGDPYGLADALKKYRGRSETCTTQSQSGYSTHVYC